MSEVFKTDEVLESLIVDPAPLAARAVRLYQEHLERSWLKDAGLPITDVNVKLVADTIAKNTIAQRALLRVSPLAISRNSTEPKINFNHSKEILTSISKMLGTRIRIASKDNAMQVEVRSIDSKSERARVRKNLSIVIDKMRDHAHPWFTFIQTCTGSIGIIRFEQVEFTSFAVNTNPGITWLINPDPMCVSQLKLGCALIHESLHHLIYMMETYDPQYSWEGFDRAAFGLSSPWTGAPLPVHSAAHAWVVWYTLSLFLSNPMTACFADTENIERELKEIKNGFSNIEARDQIEKLLDVKVPSGHSTILREILKKTAGL